MATRYMLLVSLLVGTAAPDTDNNRRLVLHSDPDILQLVDELRREVNALKLEMSQVKSGQGSTYVRWGRTVCDGNGTTKVYSGYTGGSYFSSGGGAGNVVCLPETPSWGKYKDGVQNVGAFMYGTEYYPHEQDFNPYGRHFVGEDAPCVLCHTPRSATVMIPGSVTCYPGWTREYTGYVMSGYHTDVGNSDYTCVDKNPEGELHGEDLKYGHLFHFTEVRCGSLPCQQYPEGRELACVVCSK